MKEIYHAEEGYGGVSLQREGEINYGMRCFNDPGTWELVKKHLPNPVTDQMRLSARHALDSYIFVYTKARGKREAYCTACGATYEIGNYKHKSVIECPECKRDAVHYESWRGRGKCIAANYYAFWEKSEIDNTIFQVGIICERDYRRDIRQEPEYILCDISMFREKKAPAKFHAVYSYCHGYCVSRARRACGTMFSNGAGYYYQERMPHFECNLTLKEVANGTQLGRCGIGNTYFKCLEKSWNLYNLVALAIRYPTVEYLIKMGQKDLVSEIVEYGVKECYVKLTGKTAQEVTGLSSRMLAEVKKRKITLNRGMLLMRAAFDQSGEEYTIDDLTLTNDEVDVKSLMEIDARVGLTLKRKIRYLKKQGMRIAHGANEWRDYLRQCVELGMDITDEAISMPKDLREAHNQMTARIKYKENETYNSMILKMANKLRDYRFESSGVMMHPFSSSKEIIDEGTTLHHCVGGYVKRYADGGTILCAVRRVDAPETPWHTVEFTTDGRLVQCRGLRNQTSNEDKPLLDAFWEAFNEYRTKKVRKTA